MKKIIHIDMDCFFAAVEMRDNPEYRHVPLAVGGNADRRGVVATCNYIAREYGVRSAMSSAHAQKLCPDLVFTKGRMEEYQKVSNQIRQIFLRYTQHIEPLSLDEAYLDVTDCELFSGSATLIAEDIRQAIFAETQLTASAGVAPCKFVAKIASDENKPNGICVISPKKLDSFVANLPLGKLPGVGKVTLAKLENKGWFTCADIRQQSLAELTKHFGKFGLSIWERSHGIDSRSVITARSRKSIGVERTLPYDIHNEQDCKKVIDELYQKLTERFTRSAKDKTIQSQGIKLKFSDFQQTTVEHKYHTLNKSDFFKLLEEGLTRQNNRGIRLIGLHLGLLDAKKNKQLAFEFVK